MLYKTVTEKIVLVKKIKLIKMIVLKIIDIQVDLLHEAENVYILCLIFLYILIFSLNIKYLFENFVRFLISDIKNL